MVTTTQVQAQTPQTGTITGYSEIEAGATMSVSPTVKWDGNPGVWVVNYSVNIDLAYARDVVYGNFRTEVLAEYDANVAKYKPAGGPWYQMRYAHTYKSNAETCFKENPAAYNSELVGGTGWSRSFWAAPGEKTCLTVWMYGDNVFSPKGTTHNFGAPFPMGIAYFVAPPAPSP